MQVLLNGIISGIVIAVLATAFQAVYLPTRVFFIGIAGVYAVVPYAAHIVLGQNGGWWVAVGVSVLASVCLCGLCEWANHARLAGARASEGAHLISSLGIYIVLVQSVAMAFGSDIQVLRLNLDRVTTFDGVMVAYSQWISLGIGTILLIAYAFFLRASNLGLRLRALADNPVQLSLLGYNTALYRLLAFALSGIFVAAASLVTAYDVGFDPYNGLHAVLLAVVAVIIGGRSSFLGPVVGALILGILRSEVVWYWSARWQEPATFTLLAAFILLRPEGLFGRIARLEASPA